MRILASRPRLQILQLWIQRGQGKRLTRESPAKIVDAMQEAGRALGTDRAEGLLNRTVLVRAVESLTEKTRSGNAFHPPVGTTNLSNFELHTAHSYFDRYGTA